MRARSRIEFERLPIDGLPRIVLFITIPKGHDLEKDHFFQQGDR